MEFKIHPAAFTGFGIEAQAYARGRPDYPDELLSWLRGSLELVPGRTAVDLGAGTGKFTKLLLQTGVEIIAVEPVDAMRARLSAGMPGVRAILHHTGEWLRPFDGSLFSDLEETCFEYQHVGSPQQVILDRFLSVSFIAALPAEEKSKVRRKLCDLIGHHSSLKGRDSIAFPYRTYAYCCTRR
jgi:hypothetical protein